MGWRELEACTHWRLHEVEEAGSMDLVRTEWMWGGRWKHPLTGNAHSSEQS